MAAKYITEVLKELNDDLSLFNSTYKKSGDGGPLGIVFKHAFTKDGKFLLPSGRPPFKPSEEPLGMTPAKFILETKKLHNFCRSDLKPMKREVLFVQLLEAVHPQEAEILIAIKDQTLTELYPNITRQVVASAGFIPLLSQTEQQIEDDEIKKSVRGRGRPRKYPHPQPSI